MRTIARRLTDAQLLTAARLSGAAHRLRQNEDGQASAEYAGIIFVIVAIIGGVVTFAPQIGTALGEKIKEAVETIK